MAPSRPSLVIVATTVLVPLAALVVAGCGKDGEPASITPSASYAVPATPAPVLPTGPSGVDPGPADPEISSGTAPTDEPGGPAVDGSNLLTPAADLVNVRATPWQRVTGTGRDLVVHWTSTGLAPCSLLHRVDVTETEQTVRVSVYTGESPGIKCGVAPQAGLPLAARVTLAADRGARTVVDGAR